MYKRYWLIVLVLLAPGFTLAQAPETELVNEKFYFRVGGQAFTRFRTRVRVDSETLGQGTEITLEDATNLEEKTAVARFDGIYRFTDKHSMGLTYYDIDRTGSAAIDKEITWDGEVFPIDTTVESLFRQQVLEISYGYSFLIRPKGVMTATVGLHTMKFHTGLRELGGDREKRNSTEAPLPSVGIRGQYRFGEKWRFVGKLNWLDVSVGDYRGKLVDTLLTVEHDTWDRIGLGFGINSFGLKLESGDANLKGFFDINFDSFVVFFKGHFGRN
jgi:hypothetical protein